MRITAPTAALLRKEIRELLPLWAVAVVSLLLAGVSDVVPPAVVVFMPAAVLGTLVPIALGATAVGHEYRHGTVATLLSLPVRRGHLLAAKAAALGVLLCLLAAVAWWAGARTPWLLLPLALGFCLAPWFTVLARSELAGTVFACAIPVGLLLVGELVAAQMHGTGAGTSAASVIRHNVVIAGTAGLCAIAVADTIRRFLSLQVVHGARTLPFHPTVVAGRAAVVPRHRPNVYVALVNKELRLQMLPIAIAAVFGVSWWSLQFIVAGEGDASPFARTGELLRPLFALLMAILVGAVASADERHMGVWPAQALLPVPMWKQWIVKVAVVLGLAYGFALILADVDMRWRYGYWANGAIGLPLLAAGASALALYVSSLVDRGVTALLMSVGAVWVWLFLATALLLASGGWVAGPALAFHEALAPGSIPDEVASAVRLVLSGVLLVIPVVVVVWFALKNHARLDRPARVVRRQIVAIVVATIVSVVGTQALLAFEGAVHSRNWDPDMTRMTR